MSGSPQTPPPHSFKAPQLDSLSSLLTFEHKMGCRNSLCLSSRSSYGMECTYSRLVSFGFSRRKMIISVMKEKYMEEYRQKKAYSVTIFLSQKEAPKCASIQASFGREAPIESGL